MKRTYISSLFLLLALLIPSFSFAGSTHYSWYKGTYIANFAYRAVCGEFTPDNLFIQNVEATKCKELHRRTIKFYRFTDQKTYCGEFTSEGFFVEDFDLNICRNSHPSSDAGPTHYSWYRGTYIANFAYRGVCGEYAPNNLFIQNVEVANCKKVHPRTIKFYRYTDQKTYCGEFTSDGFFVEDYNLDICRGLPNSVPGVVGTGSGPADVPVNVGTAPIKMRPGRPYEWYRPTTQTNSSTVDLLSSLKEIGDVVLTTYEEAVKDAQAIKPMTEADSEDREKVEILVSTLKTAISTLIDETGSSQLPVTHWRVRESARMVVVMSQIVASVFQDLTVIQSTSDADPAQKQKVALFAQSLQNVKVTIENLKAVYGFRDFIGESSKASVPLASVALIQLNQVRKTFASFVEPGASAPKFTEFFIKMHGVLSNLKTFGEIRGDTGKKVTMAVKALAEVWNNKEPGQGQELMLKCLQAGGATAIDAELLYLGLSSLGNVHGSIKFEMPNLQAGAAVNAPMK